MVTRLSYFILILVTFGVMVHICHCKSTCIYDTVESINVVHLLSKAFFAISPVNVYY